MKKLPAITRWDYRLIKHLDKSGATYQVHECFYGRGKKPHSWTVQEVSPSGETVEEIMRCFTDYINDTVKQPVLVERGGKIVGEEPSLWSQRKHGNRNRKRTA